MAAHEKGQDGEWHPHEEPGPANLEEWLDAWSFGTAGCIVADIIDEGVCEAYATNFKQMCSHYPRAWFICARAEWRFRSEWIPVVILATSLAVCPEGELQLKLADDEAMHDMAAFRTIQPDMNDMADAGVKACGNTTTSG